MHIALPRLRALGVVDQFDLALQLYRRNFATCLSLAALVNLPLVIVQIAYQALLYYPSLGRQVPQDPTDPTASLALLGLAGGLLFLQYGLGMIAFFVTEGVLAYPISEAYHGRHAGVGATLRYLLEQWRWLKLLLVSTALALAVLVPLSIPCVNCVTWLLSLYLFLRWLFVPTVVVLEPVGVGGAFGRVWGLTGLHLLRAFGLGLLSLVVWYALTFGLSMVLIFGIALLSSSVGLPTALVSVLSSAFGGLIQVVWLPAVLSVLPLFYYDLRIRKEGYDLAVQAERILAEGAPA